MSLWHSKTNTDRQTNKQTKTQTHTHINTRINTHLNINTRINIHLHTPLVWLQHIQSQWQKMNDILLYTTGKKIKASLFRTCVKLCECYFSESLFFQFYSRLRFSRQCKGQTHPLLKLFYHFKTLFIFYEYIWILLEMSFFYVPNHSHYL